MLPLRYASGGRRILGGHRQNCRRRPGHHGAEAMQLRRRSAGSSVKYGGGRRRDGLLPGEPRPDNRHDPARSRDLARDVIAAAPWPRSSTPGRARPMERDAKASPRRARPAASTVASAGRGSRHTLLFGPPRRRPRAFCPFDGRATAGRRAAGSRRLDSARWRGRCAARAAPPGSFASLATGWSPGRQLRVGGAHNDPRARPARAHHQRPHQSRGRAGRSACGQLRSKSNRSVRCWEPVVIAERRPSTPSFERPCAGQPTKFINTARRHHPPYALLILSGC